MNSKSFIILLITFTTIIKSNAQERMGLGMALEGNGKDTLLSSMVFKKGPMAKAGLLSTDLLQAVNGKSLLNMSIDNVLKTIHNEPPNNVKVDFLRNGKPMSYVVNKVPEISYDRECTNGNCMDGSGTITFRDGQYYYVGMCKDNKILGPGKIFVNEKLYYEGEFVNEDFQGKGKRFYSDGVLYEGNFFEGQIYGKGTLKVSDKEVYTGMFKKGYPNGFGTYLKDGITYTGFFNDWDLYFGKYTKNNITYSGYFKDNKLLGYAKLEYNSGEYYEGEINNELPNGKGFICKDGKDEVYGDFENGNLKNYIGGKSISGFVYYPFDRERKELLKIYNIPHNFFRELNFILEDSKTNFSFLQDLRTKRLIMYGTPETADSRMGLTITKEEKGGLFEYSLKDGKPSFLIRISKNLNSDKAMESLSATLTNLKKQLLVDYIKSDVTKAADKNRVTTTAYTFTFSQPYDLQYVMTVIIFERKYNDGEVLITMEIPCATKK